MFGFFTIRTGKLLTVANNIVLKNRKVVGTQVKLWNKYKQLEIIIIGASLPSPK